MANGVELYQETKDWILCRLYYREMPQFNVIKVYVPFDKSVRYVKSKNELHNICEKLFEKKYFEGHHVEIFTDDVTATVFARSVVYWISRAGMVELDEEFKEKTVLGYLLPLLDECHCSPRTKEEYMVELDRYLTRKVTLREMLMYFSTRIIKWRRGFHTHKVKIG